MDIEYSKNVSDLTEDMLHGFFIDWPKPPTCATHLRILQNSYCTYVAIDKECNRVVGFINAISDGVLTAYIPLLEVLPPYQGLGIGSELVKLMLAEMKNLYMIDVCHDEELIPYYAKFGAHIGCSSLFRNYEKQEGL